VITAGAAGLIVAPCSGGLSAQGMEARKGRDTGNPVARCEARQPGPAQRGRALDGAVRPMGASGSLSDHSPASASGARVMPTPAVKPFEVIDYADANADSTPETDSRLEGLDAQLCEAQTG
jgi:hypothetical protein